MEGCSSPDILVVELGSDNEDLRLLSLIATNQTSLNVSVEDSPNGRTSEPFWLAPEETAKRPDTESKILSSTCSFSASDSPRDEHGVGLPSFEGFEDEGDDDPGADYGEVARTRPPSRNRYPSEPIDW